MSDEFEGLGLVELLDLLEPAPEPAPISMMPQTAGWLVLAALAGAAILAAILVLIRRHRRNAYRKAALRALAGAGDDPARIAEILRRAALAAYPRREVASLSGEDWLAFLDHSYNGTGFTTGAGRALAPAPWRGGRPDPSITALARIWVQRHRGAT